LQSTFNVASTLKVRIGAAGLHLFDRNTGINLLVDEVLPQHAIAQTAVRLSDISTTFSLIGADLYRFLAAKKRDFSLRNRDDIGTQALRNAHQTPRCKLISVPLDAYIYFVSIAARFRLAPVTISRHLIQTICISLHLLARQAGHGLQPSHSRRARQETGGILYPPTRIRANAGGGQVGEFCTNLLRLAE